jgi:hypothetical protein
MDDIEDPRIDSYSTVKQNNNNNADNIGKSIKNTFNGIKQSFKKAIGSDESPQIIKNKTPVVLNVSNVPEVASEKTGTFQSLFGNFNKSTVVFGLIFIILLCIFIAYGLYYLISYSIFNQSRIIIEGTKVPILCNQYNKFSITSFNKTGNGKRRSYTFWIYIHDMNKYSGSYKHVFHIGDNGDIRRGSPFVFLDSEENKMYVRFGAINDDTFSEVYPSVQNLDPSELGSFMQQGIEIPYIPIQRWVHIAIVVNENSNGGSIVAYVDGDISKIATTGEISANGNQLKIRNLDLDKMGDLYVGGAFDSLAGPGFSGLLAKVSTYNYDLNNKDVYADYNQGPLDGFLASMGLANYGVRSPIYKIS